MNRTLSLFVLVMQSITAAPGCMDTSYHVNNCKGYDYKRYHSVTCLCPCERYPHMLDRGACRKCWHYRAPSELKTRKPHS